MILDLQKLSTITALVTSKQQLSKFGSVISKRILVIFLTKSQYFLEEFNSFHFLFPQCILLSDDKVEAGDSEVKSEDTENSC